jgi:hypothetical protein
MEKEFVTYELALRMKALGFDEPCFGFYYRKEIDLFESCKIQERTNSSYVKEFMDKEDCVAPTWQSAFRWFREKYGLYCGFNEPKSIKIRLEHNTFEIIRKESDEEAETACLEKLLEIVEEEYEKEK